MLKSTVDQYFKTSGGKMLGIMRRNYSVNFVPILNAMLEDFAWTKEKKINNIIINPNGGYYMLIVDAEIVEDSEDFKELVKMYESHGWTKP
ncbi:MAG: hypothetical protein IPJ26_15890 [Bacteroidetes bacterium]|jgi:hypothetical protein|nr:hypothetical protein [Bacteroidota bacterium]